MKWLGADLNPRWKNQWSLHSVWDEVTLDHTIKIEQLGDDEVKFAAMLVRTPRAMKPADLEKMPSGDLLDWIQESYRTAVNSAYCNNATCYDEDYGWQTKSGEKRKGGYIMPQADDDANRVVVNRQRQQGGLRPARLMNEILGKS